jgi:hypothetical protein
MALQLLVHQKSASCQRPFDPPDAWGLLGQSDAFKKGPSRNLACWREMMKHKVPVNLRLEPMTSLIRPKEAWRLDPGQWGAWMSTSPIYLLGMLRCSQSLKMTDTRDRVAATLNLVVDYDDDGSECSPYDTSLANTYLAVARLLVFKCNSLQFLAMTKLPHTTDPKFKALPSWAPNWDLPGNAECFLAPFRTAGDLPMYGFPFQEDMEDGILHVRGFRYAFVGKTLSTFNYAISPLSALSTFFSPTSESTTCDYEDIRRLAATLTEPAISELGLENGYFSRNEALLYMCILLDYASVTPGLRIGDLLPYATNIYGESREEFAKRFRSLRKFRHLRLSCLKWLDIEKLFAFVEDKYDQGKRFGHFVQAVHKTLSSGVLASTSSANLAVFEATSSVRSGDEIWILFGCPVPMILRRVATHFVVVSPAYLSDIMNGQAVAGVTSPDDKCGGWSRVLKTGRLGPPLAYSYVSGRSNWLVEVICLR